MSRHMPSIGIKEESESLAPQIKHQVRRPTEPTCSLPSPCPPGVAPGR